MRKYLRFLWAFFFLDVVSIFLAGYFYIQNQIPNTIQMTDVEEDHFFQILNHPLLTCQSVTQAISGDGYTLSCSYLGLFPLGDVQVELTNPTALAVSGAPVGVYMQTDGVLIVDEQKLVCQDGTEVSPGENIVKSGDYIEQINGKEISSKEELVETVMQSGGNPIRMIVNRSGEELGYQLVPSLCEDGAYRLGLWVRDDIQGVGTLTYVTENGEFGALGHGIGDSTTGNVLSIDNGKLYYAKIVNIKKGERGVPGELYGFIRYSRENQLGTIGNNQSNGIHGQIPEIPEELIYKEYLVGHKQEMKTGDASVICSPKGGQLQEYEIEIVKIDMNEAEDNKSFVIEVRDPRLLALTGGIVQGMSGSPVLQNGKIVGAVTHVFVNDPTKGYGIFIENML